MYVEKRRAKASKGRFSRNALQGFLLRVNSRQMTGKRWCLHDKYITSGIYGATLKGSFDWFDAWIKQIFVNVNSWPANFKQLWWILCKSPGWSDVTLDFGGWSALRGRSRRGMLRILNVCHQCMFCIFDIPVYVFQTFHVQKAWAALNNSYAWWQKFTLYEDRYTGSPGGARALGTWLRCQIWNGPFAWTKTLHATSRSVFFMYCTIVHKHFIWKNGA